MSSNNNNYNSNSSDEYDQITFVYSQKFFGVYPIYIIIGSILFYLSMTFLVFPLVRPRSKSGVLFCEHLRKVHNLFMTVFSFAIFLCAVYEIFADPKNNKKFFFLFGESGKFFSLENFRSLICERKSNRMEFVNFVFIASKIFPEILDSAFIVWLKNDEAREILLESEQKKRKRLKEENDKYKKRETGLSFLHSYHHATTLVAFLLVTNLGGAVLFGCLLNGFVHTLMYAHYCYPFPKFLVPFITLSQILQFQITIAIWIFAANETYGCQSFAQKFVSKYPMEYYTPFFFVPVYLVFFVRFFVNRFILAGDNDNNKGKTD